MKNVLIKKKTWKGSYSFGDINMKGWIDDDLLDEEVTNSDCSNTESSFTSGSEGWNDDLLDKEVTNFDGSGTGSSAGSGLSSGSVSGLDQALIQVQAWAQTMVLDQMMF